MISLESFIKGIHQAILAANESLMQRNSGLLKTFFEPVDETHNVKGMIGKVSKSEGIDGKYSKEQSIFNSKSKPKTIVIQYPHYTDEGLKLIDVEVPLITLVPINLSQVEKVKINMDVLLSLKDGAVNISFETPKPKRRPLFRRRPKRNSRKIGNIDITIKPHEGSNGLKLLIEKYENVLRAQIPQ